MDNTLRALMRDTALPRLEMQMLWQCVLQVPRAWLIAHDTDPLSAEQIAQYRALALRRQQGEPMAYILGSREFMGHAFAVTPDVLIPRPETELLVDIADTFLAGCLRSGVAAPRVLDLGTGSGAIAVSVALSCPAASVSATDASAAALGVARRNAAALGASVEFLQGSWYDALRDLPGSAFDLIVSNPPYIAAGDRHLEEGDVRFEPPQALTDGQDGLCDLAVIIEGAGRWLKPGGALYVEHGWDQAQDVRAMLAQAGFLQINSTADLAGIERVSGGLYNGCFPCGNNRYVNERAP